MQRTPSLKPRAALSAIDPSAWGELRFAFHPSLRRLHLEWNTAAVWQAMSREQAPPDPAVRRAPRAVAAMASRSAELFSFHGAAEEAAALDSAQRGETFAEICAALADWLPEEEIPLRAASLLATWADSGIIVGHRA